MGVLSDVPPDVRSKVSMAASAVSVSSKASRPASKLASASLRSLPSLPALEADSAMKARVEASLRRLNCGWMSTYSSMCADIYKPTRIEEPRTDAQLIPKPLSSEYSGNFVDHHSPPPAVPVPKKGYVPTKAELQREEDAKEKHRKQIEEARAKEQRRLEGRRSELQLGPLTAPMKPPISEVHHNYVGGPPTALWRSDYRANLQSYVHSATANARMAQPTPLAVVSSPISLFPGVVGHPDM